MELTHYGHACVLVETAKCRLLFDPGTFADGFEAARDLDAIIITHQHADHLDVERLPALLAANPDAALVADEGSRAALDTIGQATRARIVGPGERLTFAGEAVDVVGGIHATVHPDIPEITNNAFVVADGAFYHPGDSFHVPDATIDVMGAPASGPWLKVSEAVDFVRAVEPRVAVPIHELALARPAMHYGIMTELAPAATTVTILPRAEAARV